MGEEFVFIRKSIVYGESSKAMGNLEDRSHTGIMFKVEFQTPFRHRRITFFQKL